MTNFKKANLHGSNLRGVDLYGADLQEANLQGANLYGANFIETNIEGADFEGVQNLSFYQLSRVKTLYTTKLDEELFIPLKNKYPALFEKPGE